MAGKDGGSGAEKESRAERRGGPLEMIEENGVEKLVKWLCIPLILYCLYSTPVGVNVDTLYIVALCLIFLYLYGKERVIRQENQRRREANESRGRAGRRRQEALRKRQAREAEE